MSAINWEKILVITNFDESCGLEEIWLILVLSLPSRSTCETIMLSFFCMAIAISFCATDEWPVIKVAFSTCSARRALRVSRRIHCSRCLSKAFALLSRNAQRRKQQANRILHKEIGKPKANFQKYRFPTIFLTCNLTEVYRFLDYDLELEGFHHHNPRLQQ